MDGFPPERSHACFRDGARVPVYRRLSLCVRYSQYITLTIVRVKVEGKLSLSREENPTGMGYESNLNEFGDDTAGPSSTVDKLNRRF